MLSPDSCSQRQLCAGIGCALLLPITLVLSRGGWIWVTAGAGLSLLYYYNMYKPGRGKMASRVSSPGTLRWVRGGAMLILTAELSAQVGSLYPETLGLRWVGLGVLALAAAAADRGTAVVLRCASVLFVPLSLILGAVPLLALPGLRWEWVRAAGKPTDAAAALLLFLLPGSLDCLQTQVREENADLRRWMLSLGLGAGFVSFVTWGCLSPALAAKPRSFWRLARSASVFGVMLRLESFVSGALTASAFCGMALLLCACARIIFTDQKADPIPDAKNRSKKTESGRAKYLTRVPLLSITAAGLSLLPGPILDALALAAAIFCGLIAVWNTICGGLIKT